MSTLELRQLTHILQLLGSIATPHMQHILIKLNQLNKLIH